MHVTFAADELDGRSSDMHNQGIYQLNIIPISWRFAWVSNLLIHNNYLFIIQNYFYMFDKCLDSRYIDTISYVRFVPED